MRFSRDTGMKDYQLWFRVDENFRDFHPKLRANRYKTQNRHAVLKTSN
jgi:hypothetical protein